MFMRVRLRLRMRFSLSDRTLETQTPQDPCAKWVRRLTQLCLPGLRLVGVVEPNGSWSPGSPTSRHPFSVITGGTDDPGRRPHLRASGWSIHQQELCSVVIVSPERLPKRPALAWAEVTLDYCDTERAAAFWSTLLGVPANTQRIPGWYQLSPSANGPLLNLQPVEEMKSGKSRAHLDFWVDDLAESIHLVVRLGGKVLNQHTFEQWAIAVMADPEGIEFCLVAKA